MDTNLNVVILSSDDHDTGVELAYQKLNTLGFVRGSSSQEQFLLLVNDAWNATALPKNEVMRDYLAVMLNRFVARPELFEQLAGFEYCSYLMGLRAVDESTMHDLADISLQYVALYPHLSEHRHQPRSLEYSAHIGETLYARLAKNTHGKDDWFSVAFQTMSTSFGQAVMILRSVFPKHTPAPLCRTSTTDALVAQTDYEATRAIDQYKLFDLMFFEQPMSASMPNN